MNMKETTLLDNISKLVEKTNYKTMYIEITTENNKYTLEKDKKGKIGFDTNKVKQNTIK